MNHLETESLETESYAWTCGRIRCDSYSTVGPFPTIYGTQLCPVCAATPPLVTWEDTFMPEEWWDTGVGTSIFETYSSDPELVKVAELVKNFVVNTHLETQVEPIVCQMYDFRKTEVDRWGYSYRILIRYRGQWLTEVATDGTKVEVYLN